MGNEPINSDDIFYLGFNTNNGDLIDVIPPIKKELILSPKDWHKFNLLKSGGLNEKIDPNPILNTIKNWKATMNDHPLLRKELMFADVPGNSYCCGSCGGVPFCFCPPPRC